MSEVVGWVLSSSIIVACITYITNTKIKNKELLVQIKLEEQNKWVKNVDDSLKRFVELDIKYFECLIEYSLWRINENKISKQLLELNKAQQSLIFYIHQNEYNGKSSEKLMNIIESTTQIANSQREACTNLRSKFEKENNNVAWEEEVNIILGITGENEEKIGQNNVKLAMELGNLVRDEKKALADEVIKSKFLKILIGIFK